jgi:hypothetical protein
MTQTSPWVSIPAHAVEGAASDLAAALDYLAEGKVEEAQSCLVYPWTVLDTAEQAVEEITRPEYPDGETHYANCEGGEACECAYTAWLEAEPPLPKRLRDRT